MKKQISSKIVSLVFSILVLCFAIAFYAVGWDEPGSSPPSGNVAAPLNTGNITQYKSGALGIGGLFETDNETHLAILGGNVGIGTASPGQMLELYRDNADSVIRFHDPGDAWFSIGIDRDTLKFHINQGLGVGTSTGLIIDQSNNVGIGTADPSQKLDVVGNIVASGTICDSTGCIGRSLFGEWTDQDFLGNTIQGNLGNLDTNQYQATGDGFLVVRKHSGDYPRIRLYIKFAGQGSFIELYDARQNSGGQPDHSATIPIGKDDIFYINTDRVDGDFQIYWKPIGNAQLVEQSVPLPAAYVDIAMSKKREFGTWYTATARVTVTQNNPLGPPIIGAIVEGIWSGTYRGTVFGTTNVNGQVSFRTEWIGRDAGTVTFTIDKITIGGEELDLDGEMSGSIGI